MPPGMPTYVNESKIDVGGGRGRADGSAALCQADGVDDARREMQSSVPVHKTKCMCYSMLLQQTHLVSETNAARVIQNTHTKRFTIGGGETTRYFPQTWLNIPKHCSHDMLSQKHAIRHYFEEAV